jgi:hypothetical protein
VVRQAEKIEALRSGGEDIAEPSMLSPVIQRNSEGSGRRVRMTE